jgi:hypothetical protein
MTITDSQFRLPRRDPKAKFTSWTFFFLDQAAVD